MRQRCQYLGVNPPRPPAPSSIFATRPTSRFGSPPLMVQLGDPKRPPVSTMPEQLHLMTYLPVMFSTYLGAPPPHPSQVPSDSSFPHCIRVSARDSYPSKGTQPHGSQFVSSVGHWQWHSTSLPCLERFSPNSDNSVLELALVLRGRQPAVIRPQV